MDNISNTLTRLETIKGTHPEYLSFMERIYK